jgi:hypothetical protein
MPAEASRNSGTSSPSCNPAEPAAAVHISAGHQRQRQHGLRLPGAATDPDGDTLTFSLVAGPSGMTVDPGSGLLRWSPTAAQVGAQTVTLRVSDGVDAATQTHGLGRARSGQPRPGDRE